MEDLYVTYCIGPKKRFDFVSATNRDCAGIKRWKRFIKGTGDPIKRDSVELANLAIRRWREGRAKGMVANTMREIRNFIRDNPYCEVAVLVLMKAPWSKGMKIVGLCHFRRIWNGNIFIDYVAAHPLAAGGSGKSVRGVGLGLLYYVVCCAAEIGATAIWGETTQNSVEYYRKIFKKNDINDVLYIKREEFLEFKKNVEQRLSTLKA